jgi:hypothetical protein
VPRGGNHALAVLGQLPVVQLHEVRSALQRAVEPRRREIDEDRRAILAYVGHEVPVHLEWQQLARERMHTASTSLSSAASDRDEVVDLETRRRRAKRARHDLAISAAAIDHVTAAAAADVHEPALARHHPQKRLEDRRCLAPGEAAQDRPCAHLAGHASHPHALPADVRVDVVAGTAGFDRDGEQRAWKENSYARAPRRACGSASPIFLTVGR